MQGYSYTQLKQAMQDWQVFQADEYLANLDRFIFDAEKRLLLDLDLEIFDVHDQVTISQGATIIPKPLPGVSMTFTAPIAANATTGTLTSAFTGTPGPNILTLQDSADVYTQVVAASIAGTAVTFTRPVAKAALATAQSNPNFVVERGMWCLYNRQGGSGGISKIMVKRSYDFVTAYSQPLSPAILAAQGTPRYFADDGLVQWICAPAADALSTIIQRRYVQRPVSIVVAGNTYLGDNVGQCLMTCCLMEAEHFLKADDRYADWKSKYYQELLPTARGELLAAWHKGSYQPLAPVATIPASQQPQQG